MPRSSADASIIELISFSQRDPRGPVCRALKSLRQFLGRALERRLLGRAPIAILSDDCWGGEFCRTIGCAYTTPLAGAFVIPGDYLAFLENLAQPDAFELREVRSPTPYPVGRTPYATIHFMHARSWNEVAEAWPRRVARLDPARIFFKIDFGKSGYAQDDVARWNALALPNAVALLPPTRRLGLDFSHVHQGRAMPKWTHDGAAMFHLSRRAFDFHHWIRTGELRESPRWSRLLNFLFWDRLVPSEIVRRVKGLILGPGADGRQMDPSAPRHRPLEARARTAQAGPAR